MPASPALSLEVIESAMRRALELAKLGPADNENPQVGCVILGPNGESLAEGWHEGAGTPHAEASALKKLSPEVLAHAADLTAVVSLEPCNHTGRTGPCAQSLLAAGIGSVAYGMSDPGAASSGGAETLRAAGVHVTSGILETEATALLSPWVARYSRRTRPFVTVKWAQSLDGRAAAADGSSQWITGPEARTDVHLRRAAAHAILVGTGTLLADDPSLTARNSDGTLLVPAAEQPVPVVVGHRPIPQDARILSHPAIGTATPRAFPAPIQLNGDNLTADLEKLRALGIDSVFVEGGPQIVSALLRDGLVDELLIYVAPSLLGGPRVALGDIGVADIAEIKRLRVTETVTLGADILFRATLADPAPLPSAPQIETQEAR